MRADTLHLTLAFLGAVEPRQYDRLRASLAEARREEWPPRFRFCLDRLDYWRHNQIVYVTASRPSEKLRLLSEHLVDLTRSSGISIPDRPFFPHVTLVRKARNSEVPGFDSTLAFDVDRFSLVESQLLASGACYRTLGEWLLPASAPIGID